MDPDMIMVRLANKDYVGALLERGERARQLTGPLSPQDELAAEIVDLTEAVKATGWIRGVRKRFALNMALRRYVIAYPDLPVR